MSGDFTVKFEGGKELEKALMDLGKKSTAKNVARRALTSAGEPMRAMAAQKAPVDEGDLRSSVKIGRAVGSFQRMDSGDRVVTFIGIDESIDKRLHIYAAVQEFGDSKTPAQPYMRPAMISKAQEFFSILGKELWREIESASARAAKKALKFGKGSS